MDTAPAAATDIGLTALPPVDEMYEAFVARDARYDGIFVTAVRTTGIFCRPTCPARKPARENVVFFATARAALAHGFRPCLRCRPMEPAGGAPEHLARLMERLERNPGLRLRDRDLRAEGFEPAAVRRWFRANHGMTFHAYQRGRRMARALDELNRGASVSRVAFDSGYDSLSGFQEALRQITGRSPSRSRGAEIVYLSPVPTPLGPMLLGTTESAVCLLEFVDRPMVETQIQRVAARFGGTFLPGPVDVGRQLEEELKAYFEGTLTNFTTPLSPRGTEFQRRVWAALREIPYGETRSYAQQARMIGEPEAVRAVARANGDNRIAIVIPCHRVIGANGSLTGYGGGLWRKKWLLDLEQGVGRPEAQTELPLR